MISRVPLNAEYLTGFTLLLVQISSLLSMRYGLDGVSSIEKSLAGPNLFVIVTESQPTGSSNVSILTGSDGVPSSTESPKVGILSHFDPL